MSNSTYKRIEKTIIALMLVGMLAMFQPWFRSVASLFDPLTADGDLGRTYSQMAAPTIFRYGFYILLLSTIAFTSFSHYSADDLQRAREEKGLPLMWLLIVLPVFIGYTLLVNLATGFGLTAFLCVFSFSCAIAIWNWRRWGVIGYGLASLVALFFAFTGTADLTTAVLNLVYFLIIGACYGPFVRIYTNNNIKTIRRISCQDLLPYLLDNGPIFRSKRWRRKLANGGSMASNLPAGEIILK